MTNSGNPFAKQQREVAYELVPGQCANDESTSNEASLQHNVFPVDVEQQPTVTAVAVSTGELGPGTVSTSLLPREAQNLSWTDDFFDHEDDGDDIVAVFDFDYDAIQEFTTKVAWLHYLLPLVSIPLWILLEKKTIGNGGADNDDDNITLEDTFWIILTSISMPLIILSYIFFLVQTISLFPCFASRRAAWDGRSQHIAVTRDGIRFVKDKRRTWCGLSSTDAGQTRIVIQFDQITDCYIVEPVGSYLCCISHTLTKVYVAVTARSDAANGQGNHVSPQIAFPGLKEPVAFRNLVLAMKRQRQMQPRENSLTSLAAILAQSGSSSSNSGATEEVAMMLREIRNELQANRASHSDAIAVNA